MYSYKHKIDYYQVNRTFLSQSYSTKKAFLEEYNKSYGDKKKSKQLYLQILCDLKVSICEGNIRNFKKTSNILNYILDIKYTDEIFNCINEDIYPFKNTNIIILTCEYNQLEILKYIFSSYSSLFERLHKNESRKIWPNDEDENFHNAFYYSIRASNTELLEMLINKWPENYFKSHLTELDQILSKAYEELKLKNVLLSDSMKFFVEEKLINLRFFSASVNESKNNKISPVNINQRIELVIEQINSLNSINDVSEEFLHILKYIALNIFTLKRQLKVSYDTLPWEEIEFTLVCFISCNIEDKEINVLYRAVLSKAKILKHLSNFARRLATVQNVIKKTCKTSIRLSALPNISREQAIIQIIEKYPEFEELYQDYHKIRDIHTLNMINDYVTLVSLIDVNSKEGQLVIIRSLQAIGECLKNTLESPKLSAHTSQLLFLSLPKSTRKLVTNLRNSLSHAYSLTSRIETLQNEQVAFFDGVKNDIKKIGFILKDIFYANNLQILKSIFESILNCKSIDELKQIVSLASSFNMESLTIFFGEKKNHLNEYEKFKQIIEKLKDIYPDQTPGEKKIFQKMEEVISLQNTQSMEAEVDYTTLTIHLSEFKRSIETLSMDENAFRAEKYVCKSILDNLNSSTVKSKDLQSLDKLLYKLLTSYNLKPTSNEKDEVLTLITEIFCIIDIQLGNIHWVSKLRDKLTSYNVQRDTIQTLPEAKEKSMNQLKLKLLELNKILTEYNLIKSSISNICMNNRKKILTALEMLILEILSILGDGLHRLDDDFLFLDENIPLLIGKNLRNHLAHDNAILNVIPSNPTVGLIVTARKFVEELDKSTNKIGKSTIEDLKKLKNKIELEKRVLSNKQQMFDALETGSFESLKNCIAQGADVHARKNNMWTSLHSAAKGGNLDIVKFLIEQKVDIKVTSTDEKSPLHIAAKFGSASIVDFFLQQKYYDIECSDKSHKTPLHFAALNNHKVIVETLLKYNASHTVKDLSGRSPVHYAIEKNHIDVAQILLKKEKSVDANEVNGGFTALHLASERGHLELVNFLLNRGANVHARTDGNVIPLHLASLNGHTQVVDLLVKKKSNPNARARTGCTPLHDAVERGHINIANILLSNGADPNVYDIAYKQTPLHYAAKDGYVEIVQTLICYKANIMFVNANDKIPLFYAILDGHLEIVEIMCQHENAIKNVPLILHLATHSGHVKIVDYLIGLKMNVNCSDHCGNTPLHLAALKGKKDIVALLIKNKAKINVKNKDGYTPLLCAASLNVESIDDINVPHIREYLKNEYMKNVESTSFAIESNEKDKVVEMLLQNGADIHATIKDESTVLHLAAASGNCSIVEILVYRGVPVNAQCIRGSTPLIRAVMFNWKEIVNFLIENRADVNFKDKDGYTALHYACIVGSCDIVKILLNNKADVNAVNRKHSTALSIAVSENHTDIVEILIQMAHKSQIVDVNECDVQYALRNNNNDILKMLLNYDAIAKQTIKKNNFEGDSLLVFAVAKCNEDIILTLLKNGADVNSTGKSNILPLFMAVTCKREKVIKILLDHGADVNCKSSEGLTMLHLAAKRGDSEIIELLLNHDVNVNTKDDKNRTALEFAVSDGHLPIVKMLLSRGEKNVNDKGNEDFTLLHIAAQYNNHLEVIKYLVEKGADINNKNNNGSKPIHIAAREGKKETVEYFLSLGQDIDELGISGTTPLHYCALYSKVKLARYLIDKGANVNAKSLANRNPLHTAVENRAKIAFIDLLLERGTMYNTVDIFGRKPISMSKDFATTNFLSSIDKLFQAVKQNNLVDVKRCIESGAFVNARNSDNVTPLHFAAWKGYDDIVAELVRVKDIANDIGKKGLTPLHYAAKFSHLNVCKTLLIAGAIYDIPSENGKTPLDLSENEKVTNLLRLIHSCFEMVSTKRVKVIGTIKKIKDVTVIKAIMNARNVDRKSLIAAAILNDFPKVDELKEILQDDLSRQINTAKMMMMYERYDEGIKICELALKTRTELFGKKDPVSLDLQELIANALYKQQKYTVAFDMYQDIYEKYKDLFGENSKEAHNTRSSMGLVLHRQGKNTEALATLQQVYEKQRNILTLNDRNFSNTHIYMGLVLDALGKYDEALEMNTKVFQHWKNTLGSNDPQTLIARNNIAMVLSNQGKLDEAMKIYKKVYESRKKCLGPTHSDTLRAFHNMITVLNKQKKHEEAMKAYEEVLIAQKSSLGSDHVDTLNTHLNMGRLLMQQGKFMSAFKILSTSLPKFKSIVGPNHKDVQILEIMIKESQKSMKLSGRSDLTDIMNNLNAEARVAVSSGDLKAVQRMLECDVDVNEVDDDGRTLLHFAADNGNIDVARALLNSRGILTIATKKGNTPLHTAASKNHAEMVEEFLKHVNRENLLDFVNAKTTASGTTALHVAAKGGCYEIVLTLLKHGANYNPKNKEGKTPLSLSKNERVVRLLSSIDSCFKDITKGNAEFIRKLREMERDEFLATVNTRNEVFMSLMQVAVFLKYQQIGRDLLMAIKEST